MKKLISFLLAAVIISAALSGCSIQAPVTVNTDFAKLPDHVTTEMYSADYWVRKDDKP